MNLTKQVDMKVTCNFIQKQHLENKFSKPFKLESWNINYLVINLMKDAQNSLENYKTLLRENNKWGKVVNAHELKD